MANNTFSENFNALLSGMDHYVSSRTVVGDPITLSPDTVIVPLVDVSFGAASGTFNEKEHPKCRAAGGIGGKISPCAVLVIQGDLVRVLPVKNRDTLDKIMDLVPEILNLVKGQIDPKRDEEIIHEAFREAGEEI